MGNSESKMKKQYVPDERDGWWWTGRMVAGAISLFVLTILTMILNYQLGLMIIGPEQAYSQPFAVGVAMLDMFMIFLAGYIGYKTRNWFLKLCSFTTFLFLLVLSIWACLSLVLANDHRASKSAEEIQATVYYAQMGRIDTDIKKLSARAQQEEDEKKAEGFMKSINKKARKKISISKQIKRLNIEFTPDHLIAFKYTSDLLGERISPADLLTLVRMMLSIALCICPLLASICMIDEMKEKALYDKMKEAEEKT